jgi:2-polyprenyl-3-methyl-5-hydroxy-6-metoxy-1,4-benzoquinol methylase
VAVHGFKFVVREVPERVHVWRLFIAPDTLRAHAAAAGLRVEEMRGMRPQLNGGLVRSVLRRRVDPDFRFTYSASLAVGYLGVAVRDA